MRSTLALYEALIRLENELMTAKKLSIERTTKTRNPFAILLTKGAFKPKVVPSKKWYRRRKTKPALTDE